MPEYNGRFVALLIITPVKMFQTDKICNVMSNFNGTIANRSIRVAETDSAAFYLIWKKNLSSYRMSLAINATISTDNLNCI